MLATCEYQLFIAEPHDLCTARTQELNLPAICVRRIVSPPHLSQGTISVDRLIVLSAARPTHEGALLPCRLHSECALNASRRPSEFKPSATWSYRHCRVRFSTQRAGADNVVSGEGGGFLGSARCCGWKHCFAEAFHALLRRSLPSSTRYLLLFDSRVCSAVFNAACAFSFSAPTAANGLENKY